LRKEREFGGMTNPGKADSRGLGRSEDGRAEPKGSGLTFDKAPIRSRRPLLDHERLQHRAGQELESRKV